MESEMRTIYSNGLNKEISFKLQGYRGTHEEVQKVQLPKRYKDNNENKKKLVEKHMIMELFCLPYPSIGVSKKDAKIV